MDATVEGPLVRVALIDSHPIMRAGLRSVLSNESGVKLMTESSRLDDAIGEIVEQRVDVVVIGLRPPRQASLRTIRLLTDVHPEVATVVFSTESEEPLLLEALLAGAKGFLLSDYCRDEIIDAVKVAGRGKNVQVPAEMLVRLLKGLPWLQEPDDSNRQSRFQARLTSREQEILKEMATGAAYKNIADKLSLAESTVKKYAHSVITKLGVSNRSTAVITAFRLKMLEEDEVRN